MSCLETEKAARLNARRSLVLVRSMQAGEVIKREDLTFKRPGVGISPDKIEKVIGCSMKNKIKADSILQWDMLQRR